MVLVAQAKGPLKSLRDVLDAGRRDDLAVGYSEGQTRLTVELIRHAGQIKATGVPYKGGAPIMLDVIGGHLPLGVTSVLTALPHVQGGALRVVAVAAAERSAAFPDAPTLREGGLQQAESISWYGLFGPAGLPQPVVDKLYADLKKVTAEPALARQMASQGAQIVMAPPAEFAEFLKREAAKWAEVARRSGIQPE
jgi:tripartite-type tricarboxylate transporter receptor subunit TctC